jgi:ATP-dependent RNA helicase DDX51/DBP6
MTTPLKRKHVVFDEQLAAGPSTTTSSGQVRLASVNGGPPSRPAAGPVAAKPSVSENVQPRRIKPTNAVQGKSEKKKKYLVKKAKRQRKLRAAKKASTPKNREWTGAEGTAEGGEAEDSDDGSESEEEVESEVQAGPSKGASSAIGEHPGGEHPGAIQAEETEEAARARRTREKREKREQRTERKARRAAARAARMAKAAAPPSEPENDSDDDDANSDSDSSEANADPMDPAEDTFDDELLDGSPLALVDPSARISLSPSPPPLQAFPLPRAAPAPDPEILSRQGLPAGLESAEFIDQDLRLKLDDLVVQGAQGVSEQGVGERMRKRLDTIGVEDFFAGERIRVRATSCLSDVVSERLCV